MHFVSFGPKHPLTDIIFRAVPQASEFLDAQPLSKGKTEKAKKKKEASKAQAMDTGFITLPAPQAQLISNGNSPGPSGLSSGIPSSTGSPAPSKPGFSRISSAVDSPAQGGTPVPSDRSKVAFGFGAKRKAGEDAHDPPPSKRR